MTKYLFVYHGATGPVPTDPAAYSQEQLVEDVRGLLDHLGLVAAIEWQAEEFQSRTGIRHRLTVDPEHIVLSPDRSTCIFRIFQETLTNIARHAHATEVAVSLIEKDGALELSVSDNGHGMNAETVQKIFEPFFSTKKTENKGTGLGLATVYGIVKQNGGFINVYSEPGVGATFKVYLPRQKKDVEPIRQSSASPAQRQGFETVLLVEDESSILSMAILMLEKFGYSVLAFSSPSQAIAAAAAHRGGIHLLVSDVVMPEMNGPLLAEKIRSFHPEIKILFMSGYTENVIAHHGVLDEGVNFIQKPFSMDALAEKVRAVLDGAT